MKKTISYFSILTLCVCMLFGCGASSQNDKSTVANTLKTEFSNEIQKNTDIESVANKLISNKVFNDVSMAVVPVEQGYLNGFNGEISGFNSGVMFAPVIGTIPFVGYIFETDNPSALIDELTSNAMLNWNICTEADELITETVNNYVFFVMAPLSFDE